MKIEKVKLSKVKNNPDNPRVIRDDKFKKLVNSIKEFPKMLEIRPIVVDKDMIVLGGNQRLKACKEAGLKDVFIIRAEDLTPDEQKEFIVKDNTNFGDWDWAKLSEWDETKLQDWGAIEDFTSGTDYEAVIDPTTDYREMTPADIEKTREGMGNYQNVMPTITVTCPHCAEDFEIKNSNN